MESVLPAAPRTNPGILAAEQTFNTYILIRGLPPRLRKGIR